MKSNWFVEQRLAWIKEMTEIVGYFERPWLVQKFDIGPAQASLDLAAAHKRWPLLMMYNPALKRWERAAPRMSDQT